MPGTLANPTAAADARPREEGTPCAVCLRPAAAPFAVKGDYRLARCAACGFIFVDPMPAPEALAKVYAGETVAITETHYPKARSRHRRALVKGLRFRRCFRGGAALDVGCGGGFMVDAMRRAGAARSVGLDISPQALAYAARRYPRNAYYCETLEAFAERGETFDFVHASEVLEHVPDVNVFVRALAAVTRPGGRVFITTPDIGHRRVPDDVISWSVVAPPFHVQYFSHANIGLLFARHGFEIRRRYFKLQPGLQILARRRDADT